jgi:P27 family predicted phage terminase small subunit
MAVRGRKPKSALQVVREGNVDHRAARDPLVLPPSALVEPVWSDLLPGRTAAVVRARKVAAALWARLAPVLTRSVGLVNAQQETLVDFCITYARIAQGERALSLEGVVVQTDRGQVKNPWTAVLNQYRAHYRSLVGELGLSPSAVTRLTRPDVGDADDPFD